MATLQTTARVCLCLLIGASALNADQPLSVQVSPVLMPAPGYVSIRALVDASDENRALEITAESPDFVRGSTIQLDGRNAPRLSVFEFRDLPPGLYDVRAQLVGVHGKRAAVNRFVQIVPTPGWRRR